LVGVVAVVFGIACEDKISLTSPLFVHSVSYRTTGVLPDTTRVRIKYIDTDGFLQVTDRTIPSNIEIRRTESTFVSLRAIYTGGDSNAVLTVSIFTQDTLVITNTAVGGTINVIVKKTL